MNGPGHVEALPTTADAHALLLRLPLAVVRLDPQGAVTFSNERFCALTGNRPEWLIGTAFLMHVHPAELDFAAGFLLRSLATPVPQRERLRIVHRSGTITRVDLEIQPELDVRGRVTGGIVVLTPVDSAPDDGLRKRLEDRLRGSEARLARAERIARMGAWDWNAGSDCITCSPEMQRLFFPGAEQRVHPFASFLAMVHPEDQAALSEAWRSALAGRAFVCECRIVRPDHAIHVLEIRGEAARRKGAAHRMHGTAQDITQRKSLEEQLRQSQKMEAVGLLAGGIAHDFNNILTVVSTCSSLLLDELPAASPHRAEVLEVRAAAERAADLTRQLLTFSRKQHVRPRVLDANVVMTQLEKMLRRLIGEDVDLVTSLSDARLFVSIDPGHFEQIILNLVVNARDAMPGGGELRISSRLWQTSDEDTLRSGLSALLGARYLEISVADTGYGMDARTRERIFEPFFTTKAPGRGTGLGLASLYGIVRQAGGFVEVDSAPGIGSTFRVYLPACEALAADEPLASGAEMRVPLTGKRILVVEDEPALRALLLRTLTRAGCAVATAEDGQAALELLREDHHFDLVLTDVIMPVMNGPALASRLRQQFPHLPVVFMSGYLDERFLGSDTDNQFDNLLEKPFAPSDLLRHLAGALRKD